MTSPDNGTRRCPLTTATTPRRRRGAAGPVHRHHTACQNLAGTTGGGGSARPGTGTTDRSAPHPDRHRTHGQEAAHGRGDAAMSQRPHTGGPDYDVTAPPRRVQHGHATGCGTTHTTVTPHHDTPWPRRPWQTRSRHKTHRGAWGSGTQGPDGPTVVCDEPPARSTGCRTPHTHPTPHGLSPDRCRTPGASAGWQRPQETTHRRLITTPQCAHGGALQSSQSSSCPP